jgi:nitronate monooxygenase
MEKRFTTRITEMLGIEHPILCGGMQWISRADFVAAICNAGALGFITAESFETPEDLRAEIRRMRTLTDRPFGVNITMIPEFKTRPRTLELLDVVCEEGVGVVETAGQSPKALMPKLKEAGVKVIHKLTSVRHAETAQKLGVDAVALLGYGSGGHIGLNNVASFISLPLAVSRLEIPVVAAGAVCDGKGLLGALAMGAEAVLMGTRFFTTEECPIHPAVKEKVVQARETDTTLIMQSIKNPMRCVKNKLTDEVEAMEERGTTLDEILTKVSGGRGKSAYQTGDPEMSPIACGQVAGLIEKVKPVSEVIADIISEAEGLLGRLNSMSSG